MWYHDVTCPWQGSIALNTSSNTLIIVTSFFDLPAEADGFNFFALNDGSLFLIEGGKWAYEEGEDQR